MLSFTAPHGYDAVPHAAPAEAYVAMLAEGLRESRGWSEAQLREYLADRVPAGADIHL